MNWSPIIRIALRYTAGALIARGVIDLDTAALIADDPDLLRDLSTGAEALVGAVIGIASEWWYARAKKSGGAT